MEPEAYPADEARSADRARADAVDPHVIQTDRHRYVVVSHLAEGGMGAIYLGRRMGAEGRSAEVVLKQLLPEHAADPKLIEMFVREARLSANLHHPNIVRTLDLVNAGDDYYMVMEYVDGGDLRTVLKRTKRRQSRLSIESVLFLVSEVLGALAYAHDRRGPDGRGLGLIHRDVSPSNILIGGDGSVKLTDFGIAKAPTQGSVVFKVKGKIGYMAPEQARGEPVDRRTDLFAVGIVLYEALVGERLFLGNQLTPAAVLFSQSVRAPSQKRPEVPRVLDDIVLRALALDRDGRFATADEFREAIMRTAGHALSKSSFAADLRAVCGEDPATWRSFDIPRGATLDAGASEGTGVILTDEDEFDDRPLSSGSRAALLPTKELTSVVRVDEPDAGEAATRVELDPFARVGRTSGQTSSQTSDFDDDDAVRTRVHAGGSPSGTLDGDPAPTAPARAPVREPRAPAREPERKRRSSGQIPETALPPSKRAVFEPPVPRAAIPRPDDSTDSLAPTTKEAALPRAPLPPVPRASAVVPPRSGPEPAARTTPGRSRRNAAPDRSAPPASEAAPPAPPLPPASLSSLERALGPKSTGRVFLVILVMLALVGLGIGVGVLISGSNNDLRPGNPAAPR